MSDALASILFTAFMICVYFGMFMYCTSLWKFFWLALFLGDTYIISKNIVLISTLYSEVKNKKK